MGSGKYHAIKGINEDSFGYDFINYVWKGAVEVRPLVFEMVTLQGEEAVMAHQVAISNPILEDGVTTGDIAAPPGGTYSIAMGTERPEVKKKRKKGSQILFGDKDEDK